MLRGEGLSDSRSARLSRAANANGKPRRQAGRSTADLWFAWHRLGGLQRQTRNQQSPGEEARRILRRLSGGLHLNLRNPILSDTPAIRRNVYLLPKFSLRAMISLLYPQSVLEPRTPD